jgi:hypothetical protein
MVKILILIIPLFLVGCSNTPLKIKTEIQQVYIPLLYCPAPPVIERPTLPIHMMTERQLHNPGEVAKHYKATVRELIGYSHQLELTLDMYDKTSKGYEEMKQQFEQEIKPNLISKEKETK